MNTLDFHQKYYHSNLSLYPHYFNSPTLTYLSPQSSIHPTPSLFYPNSFLSSTHSLWLLFLIWSAVFRGFQAIGNTSFQLLAYYRNNDLRWELQVKIFIEIFNRALIELLVMILIEIFNRAWIDITGRSTSLELLSTYEASTKTIGTRDRVSHVRSWGLYWLYYLVLLNGGS